VYELKDGGTQSLNCRNYKIACFHIIPAEIIFVEYFSLKNILCDTLAVKLLMKNN